MVDEVVIVTAEVPAPPVTVVGLKLAPAPVGNPLALIATLPVNPFSALIVAVYPALFPAVTVCVPGVVAIEKSAVPPTGVSVMASTVTFALFGNVMLLTVLAGLRANE